MFDHFIQAQEMDYEVVMAELAGGQKRSHWIWYIFPQLSGLGRSPMANKYALNSLEQAALYYQHPILGPRLKECVELMLDISGKPLGQVLPYPDNLKFISSMTLFHLAVQDEPIFAQALQKYNQDKLDDKTVTLLG